MGGETMERSVSFRFYKVERRTQQVPALAEVLQQIAGVVPKKGREREVATDVILRLEEFEKDGPSAVVGELVRVQTTNLPSEVLPTGRSALSTKNPLGHGVAFRYVPSSGVLCFQHEPRIASVGRFIDYLSTAWSGANYVVAPMLRPGAWKRFNSGEVRKLAVRIASPDHLGDVGPKDQAAASAIKAMAAAYEAPSIRIEFSMGNRKGKLAEAVKTFAKGIWDSVQKGGAGVEQLQAVTYSEDGRDEIDLIEERLKIGDDLALDDRDPEKNYKIKKAFLSTQMGKALG
jgi:hypothetical protein